MSVVCFSHSPLGQTVKLCLSTVPGCKSDPSIEKERGKLIPSHTGVTTTLSSKSGPSGPNNTSHHVHVRSVYVKATSITISSDEKLRLSRRLSISECHVSSNSGPALHVNLGKPSRWKRSMVDREQQPRLHSLRGLRASLSSELSAFVSFMARRRCIDCDLLLFLE